MEILQKGAVTYVITGGSKYQIAEEKEGGLMIRLIEGPKGIFSGLLIRASAGNTIHVSPDE